MATKRKLEELYADELIEIIRKLEKKIAKLESKKTRKAETSRDSLIPVIDYRS